jgi:Na+(H+)/acetate symporter ActP
MKGITWTQVAQYAVLIVAYLIPAIAIAAKLGPATRSRSFPSPSATLCRA